MGAHPALAVDVLLNVATAVRVVQFDVGTTTEGPLALGSGSQSDVELHMGSPTDKNNPAETQTTIGKGAMMTARDTTLTAVATFNNTSNGRRAQAQGGRHSRRSRRTCY